MTELFIPIQHFIHTFGRYGMRLYLEAVDSLITNFHLPKSSLLVLVSALASREMMLEAYQTAIDQEYRFFSYGDAMMID